MMLKKDFQKELDKLGVLNEKYKKQLFKVENKIIEVFGCSPSDIDCDSFIDIYHTGQSGTMSVNELNREMEDDIRIKRNNEFSP